MEDGASDPAPSVVYTLLADAWRQTLQTSEVAAGDNFFAMGGDSLKATALVAHIEAQFGLTFDPIEIFNEPVFGRMVELIERALPSFAEPFLEEGVL